MPGHVELWRGRLGVALEVGFCAWIWRLFLAEAFGEGDFHTTGVWVND